MSRFKGNEIVTRSSFFPSNNRVITQWLTYFLCFTFKVIPEWQIKYHVWDIFLKIKICRNTENQISDQSAKISRFGDKEALHHAKTDGESNLFINKKYHYLLFTVCHFKNKLAFCDGSIEYLSCKYRWFNFILTSVSTQISFLGPQLPCRIYSSLYLSNYFPSNYAIR